MATVKVKFRPSTTVKNEGTVYYQIIHERKSRQFFTDYHVFPFEWDENHSMVTAYPKKGADDPYEEINGERMMFLLALRERIRWDMERLNKIVRGLDGKGIPYNVDDVVDEFVRYSREYTLFNYMEKVIVKLKGRNRIRTSETYRATLNSFKRFRNEEDIMLDCLDTEVMESYEAWQRSRGVSANTISFYTRILRAVYHRAVEEEIIENRNPFRHVYTGIDKTIKRALPFAIIKKIKGLDLSLYPSLDYARDMFMFSFMLRGMSFIDMAFLKKTDLKNGYITYRRRKTGQQLIIAWTKEMQLLLDKYPENDSDYLLPIIRTRSNSDRSVYRNVGYNINHNLKAVASMVGVGIPLTLYVARHSWATAAKAKGIPLSVISEGMGHDSETTTQIYLASLDTSVVDKANSIILKGL